MMDIIIPLEESTSVQDSLMAIDACAREMLGMSCRTDAESGRICEDDALEIEKKMNRCLHWIASRYRVEVVRDHDARSAGPLLRLVVANSTQ